LEDTKLGEFSFTVDGLVNSKTLRYAILGQNLDLRGEVEFSEVVLEQNYSFYDYLSSDFNLNLMVAVDFTENNGSLNKKEECLHSLGGGGGGKGNLYLECIKALYEVLANYNSQGIISLYGYGAVPLFPTQTENQTNHCFAMSGDVDKQQCSNLADIIECYKKCVQSVKFSGPTRLAPLLSNTLKVCENNSPRNYLVLLILTSGALDDVQETKQYL
jgi:hypothetical protein